MTIRSIDATADDGLARRNALVLACAQAMGNASNSIVIATGGLAGLALAPSAAFATVPVTSFVLGSAASTVPASMLMHRIGRRRGFMVGTGFGFLAGTTGSLAIAAGSFALLCLATFLAGAYGAFVQYYRFAAADTASERFKPRAISWVMAGGVVAGVIGPQIVIHTRAVVPEAMFMGTYMAQAGIALVACAMVSRVSIPLPPRAGPSGSGRPLGVILAQPRLVVAIVCGAASYALMNFVMTASPLAMVDHGHSVDNAALGIQWHIIAMFGPSFFTGDLIARFGKERMVAAGFVLLIASGLTGLAGTGLWHFWGALVLLGVGWNFSFLGATTMVTDWHRPEERNKTQAANDLVMWSSVAIASLSSGMVLSSVGWVLINALLLPVCAGCLAVLVFTRRRAVPST